MKKVLRIGVRAKFVLLIGVLLGLVFAVMTTFLARQNAESLKLGLYNEAKAFATLATDPIGSMYVLYKDSGTLNIDSAIKTYTKLNKNITNVSVIDLSGNTVYAQDNKVTRTYPKSVGESFDIVYLNDSSGVLETVVSPYRENNGIRRYSIVFTVSSLSIKQSTNRALASTLVFGTIWLSITLLCIYLLVNVTLIRRIRTISEQSKLISDGEVDQVIAISSNDELGDLARSLNKMADSLKADIDKLRQLDQSKSEFMMITSHNLRTPLTIIDTYIDSAQYFSTIDQFKHALKEISGGSKRLGVFAEDVLTISQLELGEKLQAPSKLYIHDFLEEIAHDFREFAKLKEVKFESSIPISNALINVSKPYMRAALWNLLDNALKFTPKDGLVKLSQVVESSKVIISISDTGIGIGESEIPELFTKFHRGTSTMIYDYEGTGIGLYATKMIVERHDGMVHVMSKVGEGSTFTITLPLHQQPEPLNEPTQN